MLCFKGKPDPIEIATDHLPPGGVRRRTTSSGGTKPPTTPTPRGIKKASASIKQAFVDTGLQPTRVPRDTAVVNLECIHNSTSGLPPGHLDPTRRTSVDHPTINETMPSVTLNQELSSSLTTRRGFVRVQSIALRTLSSSQPHIPDASTVGHYSSSQPRSFQPSSSQLEKMGFPAGQPSLPGSCASNTSSPQQQPDQRTTPHAEQQQHDSRMHVDQLIIPARDSYQHQAQQGRLSSPGHERIPDPELSPSKRALQWTASRRALAVLMVKEEVMSRTDQGLHSMSHDRRLAERLQRLNLEMVVMAGDGNCQFRTIASQIYGSQDHHQRVRDEVVNHMRQNREEYECFLGEDFDVYLSCMSRPGTWGDELCLRAACDAYGVVMNVVTSDAQNWFLTYEPLQESSNMPELFLCYIAPIHYNSITRKPSLKQLSKHLSSSFRRITSGGGAKSPADMASPRTAQHVAA